MNIDEEPDQAGSERIEPDKREVTNRHGAIVTSVTEATSHQFLTGMSVRLHRE